MVDGPGLLDLVMGYSQRWCQGTTCTVQTLMKINSMIVTRWKMQANTELYLAFEEWCWLTNVPLLIWPAIIGLIGRSRYRSTGAHQPRGIKLATAENAFYFTPSCLSFKPWPAVNFKSGVQGQAGLSSLSLSIIKTTVYYVNWMSPSSLIFKS